MLLRDDYEGSMLNVPRFFGKHQSFRFESQWEVLLGQSEVANYLKDPRPDGSYVPMRYGGEWKLAGGHIEDGETPLIAAKRVTPCFAPVVSARLGNVV